MIDPRKTITSDLPTPSFDLRSVPNLRDVGGRPTRDGSIVRTGLLYRSSDLSGVDPGDAETVAGLGLRSVFDLRSEAERTAQPDRLPPGAGYVAIDVLEGSPDLNPGRLMRAVAEPRGAAELLGDGRAAALWRSQYRQLVSLGSARAGYGRLFRDLLDPTRRPALVHCTTGKDRTGWAVAALLFLLDVDAALIMDDFVRSGQRLAARLAPALERFRDAGGDPDLLRPIAEARPEYLETAIAEVHASFGSIEGYFADGLGLGPDAQDALRSIFVARER